ncbi:hypothetical protein UFOVP103_38 [uncultured Caudovirales phage]|uniref:Uncharacterized protein n=1 Tax=uncultured Caudovirales phage TaxID=2100421 RepID=A0A6J5L0Y2_9CAUD|nr:hypothetical protein UFOVP103_38 [uncultured Caudovirales phage]CAB5216911.1 hypothetical protein UFOVP197_17 [uncultured Caudovirales phage]
MEYAVKISNEDSSTAYAFVIDSSLVIDGNINLMDTLKAHKLDANEIFNKGNRITFGTLENDEFKPLHEFKKWW